MPPTLQDRVAHILEAIEIVGTLVEGSSREKFSADKVQQAAVERFLERISEASRHLPSSIKQENPAIAWQRMADLGNRLRHAYHSVDPMVVWHIVTTDLKPLRSLLQGILTDGQQ